MSSSEESNWYLKKKKMSSLTDFSDSLGKLCIDKSLKGSIDEPLIDKSLKGSINEPLIDKSLKGSIDEPLIDILSSINKIEVYISTSSCSGRISVYLSHPSGKKNKGELLFSSHSYVNNAYFDQLNSISTIVNNELISLQSSDPQDITLQYINTFKSLLVKKFNEIAQLTVYDKKNKKKLNTNDQYDKSILWLNVEPFIIHIEAMNFTSANDLLSVAFKSGLKQSGIIPVNKIIVAIRDSIRMNVPIGIIENGTVRYLIQDDYLQMLIVLCNTKLKKTWANITRFHMEFSNSHTIGGRGVEVGGVEVTSNNLYKEIHNSAILFEEIVPIINENNIIAFQYPNIVYVHSHHNLKRNDCLISIYNLLSQVISTPEWSNESLHRPEPTLDSICVALEHNMFFMCGVYGYLCDELRQTCNDSFILMKNPDSSTAWTIQKIEINNNVLQEQTISLNNVDWHCIAIETHLFSSQLIFVMKRHTSQKCINSSENNTNHCILLLNLNYFTDTTGCLKIKGNWNLIYENPLNFQLSGISSNLPCSFPNNQRKESIDSLTNRIICLKLNCVLADFLKGKLCSSQLKNENIVECIQSFISDNEYTFNNQYTLKMVTLHNEVIHTPNYQIIDLAIFPDLILVLVKCRNEPDSIHLLKFHIIIDAFNQNVNIYIIPISTNTFEKSILVSKILVSVNQIIFINQTHDGLKIYLGRVPFIVNTLCDMVPCHHGDSYSFWLGVDKIQYVKELKCYLEEKKLYDKSRRIIPILNLSDPFLKLLQISFCNAEAIIPVKMGYNSHIQDLQININADGIFVVNQPHSYNTYPVMRCIDIKIFDNKDTLHIPIKEKKHNEYTQMCSFFEAYKASSDDNLIATIDKVPCKWEKLGDIILFRKSVFTEIKDPSFWLSICKILKCRSVGVLDRIQGPFRNSTSYLLLPGSGDVIHKDNSIYYTFDVTKCMFSSGNSSERKRIVHSVNSFSTTEYDNIFVDMYCGIGYFTLPVLKNCKNIKEIWACDWNSNALMYLSKGIQLNDIPIERSNCVHIMHGDSTTLGLPEGQDLGLLKGKAQFISLGLIPSSEEGWKAAVRMASRTGCLLFIHIVYPFTPIKHTINISEAKSQLSQYVNNSISDIFKTLRNGLWIIETRHVEKVKSYCPFSNHYVIEIYCYSNDINS